ncbi:hypothetical protein K0M31_003714 [Melipona bicolor]|uniref:Uncharacterized protein n=1 Tax=Melipona bicolor TaxID=60889 RepID=A0AA40FY81_9HYME|nr:hypothetical protein K0M31_003714 [Melipona bicolor]
MKEFIKKLAHISFFPSKRCDPVDEVVMCGAVPAMVRSVSLYSTCSSGNVTVIGRSIKAVVRDDQNAPYRK